MAQQPSPHAAAGHPHFHMAPALREDGLRRLQLIAGQVRGLQRMLDEDRYCVDVMTQIEAARAALRQVGHLVMRNYLENCVAAAVRRGEDGIFDEAMDVWNKFSR